MNRPAPRSDAFVPGPRGRLPPTGTGPLDGLRLAVKDLIDVEGFVTGGGNPDWRRHGVPTVASSPAVAALLAAGACFVGQTVTDELAFSLEGANAHDGTPENPAAPDRLPGGSSSGSASAVASGATDIALGTDTGGSVRIPASFCGLYGFRPTHGRISLEGVLPFAPSYDTMGWFARDARTLASVGRVLFGESKTSKLSHFVVVEDAFALADVGVSEPLRAAFPPSLTNIEATDVFVEGPDAWREAYRVLQGAEIWTSLGPWISKAKPRFGASIAERFRDASSITGQDVSRWQPLRETIRARLYKLLSTDTALVIPTSPTPALSRLADGQTISDFYARALPLTAIAGHAGLPQVTVPLAKVMGAPVGLSLVGSAGSDEALLDAASRLFGTPYSA